MLSQEDSGDGLLKTDFQSKCEMIRTMLCMQLCTPRRNRLVGNLISLFLTECNMHW